MEADTYVLTYLGRRKSSMHTPPHPLFCSSPCLRAGVWPPSHARAPIPLARHTPQDEPQPTEASPSSSSSPQILREAREDEERRRAQQLPTGAGLIRASDHSSKQASSARQLAHAINKPSPSFSQ